MAPHLLPPVLTPPYLPPSKMGGNLQISDLFGQGLGKNLRFVCSVRGRSDLDFNEVYGASKNES